MCTVTLLRGGSELLLTMNRDERWARAPERPPIHHPARAGRPAWVAPADGERGGAWIGANDAGVVACLLNAYAPGDLDLLGREGVPSRGELLPRLLGHRPDEVLEWVDHELDAPRYPSFTLILLAPDEGRAVHWRLDAGLQCESLASGWSVVTSSLWRGEEVSAWRHEAFARWCADGVPRSAGVPSFNLLEVAGHREWSPFMTRPFSATRSITQVRVGAGERSLTMTYWSRRGADTIDPSKPDATLDLPLNASAPTRSPP